MAITMRLI